jgi:tetratricopeptide (TPR) repeat protein
MAVNSSLEPPSRHRLDSFTDREQVLTQFQQMLRTAQAGEVHLLSIKGHSGTGKTFLIEYLTERICPQAGWRTGKFDFTQSLPDFRSILNGVEDTLKECVPGESLKQYRIKLEEYKRRFDEYRAVITVNQHVEAKEASSISHIQQHVQVDAELHRRERQLQAELNRALLELAEECGHSLCLFLDGYERLAETDSELVGWLWEEVLLKLVKNVSKPVLIITCGWDYPSSAALHPYSTQYELDDFDRLRTKSYLQAQSIIPSDASYPNDEVLAEVFFSLTHGHPFVLSLAVTYYQTLPESERNAESLRTRQPLLDEEARVQWLDERLLKRNRLPEPFRTLLERGPVLRAFDQSALQALLRVGGEDKTDEVVLDDRTYAQFLHYPFINRKNLQGNALLEQPTFHDLTRKVRLATLRRWHPETKQRLHRAMVEYFRELIEAERQQYPAKQVTLSDKAYADWFAEKPEQEFQAQLEWFYHALQVKEMQTKTYNRWLGFVDRALDRWRRNQAGPLLELVRQLTDEGEPFLDKQSDPYGHYLFRYSRFLEQERRWDAALSGLQEAVRVFEQRENPSSQAACLDFIGNIYSSQNQLDTALNYYQRAHSLGERAGASAQVASSLHNIGVTYQRQGQLDTALGYFLRALSLYEQMDNPEGPALLFNSIGTNYGEQGQIDTALDYFQRALPLFEQIGNPEGLAHCLHNIGLAYRKQGKLFTALSYFQRELSLREQTGDPASIVDCLKSIGQFYAEQGELDTALDYWKRELSIRDREQIGDPEDIAHAYHAIGLTYAQRREFNTALDYWKRALFLREEVGDQKEIASFCYNIAGLYLQLNHWKDAIPFFSRAASLYEQMGHDYELRVADAFEYLAVCYSHLGESWNVTRYYAQAMLIRKK